MEDGHAGRVSDALETKLAPRELAVAALRLQGVSVQDVARELGIKPASVRTTMHRVYQKYGVSSLEDLSVILAEQGDGVAHTAELADTGCRLSVSAMASLMLETSYLVCAPIAVAYICFMQSSPLRFHLNDAVVTMLMVSGALASSMLGPIFKRNVVDMPKWAQLTLALGVLALLFPIINQALFGRVLLGYVSAPGEAGRLGSYALCLVVSLLAVCVVRTTELTSLAVVGAHPSVLISVLSIQFLCAAWAATEGSIALVVLVTTIVSSSLLICCAGKSHVSDAPFHWKLNEALLKSETAPPWALHGAPLVFGVSLGVSQLSAASFPVRLASCLPAIALIVFVVHAMYRIKMPISHLWSFIGLDVCSIAVVSMSAHSYRAGVLVGAIAAFAQVRGAFHMDATARECVRRWRGSFAMDVCVGAIIGSVFWGISVAPNDLQAATTLEFARVGAMLLLALVGVYAIWLLRMTFFDMLARTLCDGAGCLDDMRRVRALLMLRGMSDYECEVILRTVAGASVQAIAEDLHYSTSSVKAVRGRAYRMFGVHGVAGLKKALSQVGSL